MTSGILRGLLAGGLLAVLALLAARLPLVEPLQGRTLPATTACLVILALTPMDWLAPLIAYLILRRDPSVTALRDQLVRFIATAVGGAGIALLAALYLFGYRLVGGGGLVVLALALVAFKVPPLIWTVNVFRRR